MINLQANTNANEILKQLNEIEKHLDNLKDALCQLPPRMTLTLDVAEDGFREETKHCVCTTCGKKWHFDDAEYCGMCGTKLKEASDKDSL